MIEGARRLGSSISKLVNVPGFSNSTASQGFMEWKLSQTTLVNKDNSGQKTLVNERGERQLAPIVHTNRRATTCQIAAQYH